MNRRINRYCLLIRILAHDDTDTLEDVLHTLGRAAHRAERRISDVAKTQDGDCLAEIIAEETMLVEDLIGCAFVAAQTYIARIISRVIWLHQRVARDGHVLKTTCAKKPAIIHGFNNLITKTKYSEIELIDAFANYFKHHEEWPKWDNATGQSERTIRVIRSVGASEDSSDNCRKGLTALGIDPVFHVFTMVEILSKWLSNLADAYKQELNRLVNHDVSHDKNGNT
ncbi:MAG: hypothetical protein ISS70_23795 [Phycisphaerae bacterium]|nr:hypothetical protein [Phycisphaerae bacterium]